jgi:hypothetical protein
MRIGNGGARSRTWETRWHFHEHLAGDRVVNVGRHLG